MNYEKTRDYAFLSQAAYRFLSALPRSAFPVTLRDALSDAEDQVPSPQNRFALQIKGASVELFSGAMT